MADSILKDIYNDIRTALIKIPEFSPSVGVYNVDLYKNQINTDDLTSFPFALVDFPYIYYKDASARVQLGHALVKVFLCFDVTALTGANVTDAFELKEKVYAYLQGGRKRIFPDLAYAPDDKPKYSPMTRGTERMETKYPGIYVIEMDFYTTIQDDGVYILKGYTAKTNVALEMDKGVEAEGIGTIDLMIQNPENKHNEIRTGKIV